MTKLPRVHLPIGKPEDVIGHLGKPSHWKQGRSAKSLADGWFTANDIPGPVRAVLDQSPRLRDARLVDAFLERQTDLEDDRPSASQTDLLAILSLGTELALLGVEAKVTETFGDYVRTWLDGGPGKETRLGQLCERLGLDREVALDLRYQLLHRTMATVLEARRYCAPRAVMMVQSFCESSSGLEDFVAFGRALGFEGLGLNQLSEEIIVFGVSLQLGWVADTPPAEKRIHRSVEWLNEFGRTRLSPNFFMRDFLYSEIAAVHGLANVPDDPELAVEAGSKLCEDLLEPLQQAFGRISVRSAYRSAEVNHLGNRMQKLKEKGYNCSANEANFARHIWDVRDENGFMGATACIVVPGIWERFGKEEGGWTRLAWWIHDNLPYSELTFFPRYWAFNISWSERPRRQIRSHVAPLGVLTAPGMANFDGSHQSEWANLPGYHNSSRSRLSSGHAFDKSEKGNI